MGTPGRALAALIISICPAVQAAAWSEYKTEHFILDTDAPEMAGELMAALEKARATDMAVLAGGELELAGHIRVVAPSSLEMFQETAGNSWIAAFYTHGPYAEPVILAPAKVFFNESETLAHELTHAVSHYLFPEQPHWYAEGLAQFVETVAQRPANLNPPATGSHMIRAAPRGAVPAVGAVPNGMEGYLRNPLLAVPSAELLSWHGDEDPVTPGRYHAASWVLYHYLWNQRGKELAALQKRLLDGEGFAKAWLASFADLDPGNAAQMQALDLALLQYVKTGKFMMVKLQRDPQFQMSRQEVSPADIRLWLLNLRGEWPSPEAKQAAWRAQMQKARLEDPKNPAVLLALASLDGKLTAEVARTAAANAPKDFRGWYILAGLEKGAKEKEPALRKAAALGDECPACQNDLAWFLATSGRAKEALPFANRALDLAPWDASAVDTMAEVALRLGQCPQALQLVSRAVSMLLVQGRKASEFDARLQSVQQRCAAK